MDIESFYEYCLSKPWVTDSFPFDKKTLVFKVAGKMFALVDVDKFDFINLKCDPERALELREAFNGIKPGWHMNKTHWNSVYTQSDVPERLLKELIDLSYNLVYKSLPKKVRDELSIR